MKNRRKLGQAELEFAAIGGAILGGGGGGSADHGRKYAEIAVAYRELYLYDINDFSDEELLLTASLVGAPKAPDQYMTAAQFVRSFELFQQFSPTPLAGIITNENGGSSTFNGWIPSAVLGIPLVDAPCNGRAHPTGIMGSMNLHKNPDYITTQTAVGGNPALGRNIECVFKGTIDHTARLVRQASIDAGGLVGVARNPVTVAHAKKNNAIGGVTSAIETGEAFMKGLSASPEKAVTAAMAYLGGEIIAKGTVKDFEIITEGGFDVGFAKIDDVEMTFWNEYMTLDKSGQRKATFPDLIMTFDVATGTPLSSAMIEPGMEVYVAAAPSTGLKLSSTMHEVDLLKEVEGIVGKELVSYMR